MMEERCLGTVPASQWEDIATITAALLQREELGQRGLIWWRLDHEYNSHGADVSMWEENILS